MQPEDIQRVIAPIIKSFFHDLTEDQWAELKSSKDYASTRFLVAELIVNLIVAAADAILEKTEKRHIPSADDIKKILGSAVSRTFRDVLGVDDGRASKSADKLDVLMTKDVAIRVIIHTYDELNATSSVYITPPNRLGLMTRNGCKMMKEFVGDTKMKFTPRQRRSSSDEHDKHDQEVQEKPSGTYSNLTEEDDTESVQDEADRESSPVEPSTSSTWSPKRRPNSYLLFCGNSSSSEQTAPSCQEKIEEKVREFMLPFVEPIDCEYSVELCGSAVKNLAAKIAEYLTEIKESGDETTRDVIADKIKTLFREVLARAWLTRIVIQLKRYFPRDAMSRVLEIVHELVDQDESPEPGDELSFSPWSQTVPFEQNQLLAKELSDYLYRHLTPAVGELIDAMHRDIRHRVKTFLSIFAWIQHCRDNPISNLVSALVAIQEDLGETDGGDAADVSSNPEQERRRDLCRLFLEMLSERTTRKAKGINPKPPSQRLFDQTWAAVKDVDFGLTYKKFKDLDKVIHKDLCRKYRDVLQAMNDGREEMEDDIAVMVGARLKEKCQVKTGFLARVWRTITTWRRGSSVDSL